MATLDMDKIKVEGRNLHIPSLDELKPVLLEGLSNNFAEVNVEVVDCPDLTQPPFALAASGLCGNGTILEVGGPSFLLPTVQRDKIYDIQPLLQRLKYNNNAFVIGAGAGPWPYLNSNCEMMMNVAFSPSKNKIGTYLASVNSTGNCVLETVKDSETRFALLANLFVSEGRPGKVLKVSAKKRTGTNDFIASMQKALAVHYKGKLVGLGGTFLMNEGKVKQHVMQDFSRTPLNTEKALNEWLRFYNMSTPLIAVGTFVSDVTDLDLRVQHFHSFSDHNEGGHYHIDTTPETIEYLGYFNVGSQLYRVDQPANSVEFGKD